SLIYPRTFTILPSATSTTPSLHVRIWQDGDYHKVLIAPFVLILNHSFMLSLVVNSTLIALPRDTTQSLTSLPSHFNLPTAVYVLELTVGFESNLNNNAVRKKEKYLNLINEMSRNYKCVRFVNLSMSSLGVFSDECSTFLDMMNDI
ncbi:unnamed protein product, partial [Porites evermanni]